MSEDTLAVGAIVVIDGVRKRHLGGGMFEPVGEEMFKRFDGSDCGPIVGGDHAQASTEEV